MENFEILEFKFVSRNGEQSGKIQLLMSTFGGIFYDWHVYFDKATIQLGTTGSWFDNSGVAIKSNSKLRDKLFNKLNIEQLVRIKKDDKNYSTSSIHDKKISLNNDQLSIINNWFNSLEYNSTFKNVASMLLGCNPTGELLNPKNAQFLESDHKYNFSIFLSQLIDKKDGEYRRGENYNARAWELAKKQPTISITEWISQFPDISKYFLELNQKQYNKAVFYKIGRVLKFYSLNVHEINNMAKKEWVAYSKNINARYSNPIKEIFGVSSLLSYQKAHIYPRHLIKQDALKAKSKENRNKIMKMISDENNFLPLDATTHELYDRKKNILWNEKGNLVILDLKANEDKNLVNYKKIENKYLGSRVKYIKKYKECFEGASKL